jgi:hypothetical protein
VMYLGLLVVVLVVMILMRIGRASSSPGSSSKFKFGTRNVVTASVDSHGAPTKIVFNGQEYSSVDEMPPVARAAYKLTMGMVLADADHDGVPDLFKSVGAGDVSSAADPAARMKQLQNMKDAGLITNDEYEAKRTQILDKL